MAVIARRIAICQHPHGEGVWWDTDSHPHPGCIQDCDCTPVEYVLADIHAGVVEERDRLLRENAALRGLVQAARGDLTDGPDLSTTTGEQ